MAKGIDYAFYPHPSISAIKAEGATFVCRYVSSYAPNDGNGKNLIPAEKNALLAAGLSIVIVAEEASGSRMLDGRAAGVTDAAHADAVVKALGMPGIPVYFACDWDATEAQQTPIDAYLDGAVSVIGRGRVGIYAGFYPLKRAFDAGKITYGWETYAWSGGQWDSRAQLRQTQNGVTIGGADCDRDVSMSVDYGQWPRPSGYPVIPTVTAARAPQPAPPPVALEDHMPQGTVPPAGRLSVSAEPGTIHAIKIYSDWAGITGQTSPPQVRLRVDHLDSPVYDTGLHAVDGTYTYTITTPSDVHGFSIERADTGPATVAYSHHMTPITAQPGDVLAVRTGGWTGRIIRFGAALRDQPNLDSHIAVIHHKDAQGTLWCVEGRPGGVGLAGHPRLPVLEPDPHQRGATENAGATRRGMRHHARHDRNRYDWSSIVADTEHAFGLNTAWLPDFQHRAGPRRGGLLVPRRVRLRQERAQAPTW